MLDTFRTVTTHQLEAALRTLHACIEACPDAMWRTPIARYTFDQVVFHTLFFTDYYLGPDEASFRTQPYHHAHAEFFADYEELTQEPTSHYDKASIRDYMAFCRQKVTDALGAETAESLAAPARFARRDFTRAELYLYVLRHIQHHAAQLILRLRLDSDVDIAWYGSGWSA